MDPLTSGGIGDGETGTTAYFLIYVNASVPLGGHVTQMSERDRLRECAYAMIQWHGRSAAAEAYRLADAYYFEHDDERSATSGSRSRKPPGSFSALSARTFSRTSRDAVSTPA